MARERVLGNPFADQQRQAVEAFAHVGGSAGQEDAKRRRQAQHVRASSAATTRLSVSASNPGITTIRGPLGSTTSMVTQDACEDVSGVALSTATGRNRGVSESSSSCDLAARIRATRSRYGDL